MELTEDKIRSMSDEEFAEYEKKLAQMGDVVNGLADACLGMAEAVGETTDRIAKALSTAMKPGKVGTGKRSMHPRNITSRKLVKRI